MYRLRRSPRLWWSFVIAVALGLGLFVQQEFNQAAAQAAQYGDPVWIYVAHSDIAAGHKIELSDIARRQMPRAFVPEHAVVSSPVGNATLVSLSKGETLLQTRLAPSGLEGPAALLPENRRAIAIPATADTPQLHIGDLVDLVVSMSGTGVTTAQTLAHSALVIGMDDHGVTIAVLPQEVETVAYGLVNGTASLVLTSRQ